MSAENVITKENLTFFLKELAKLKSPEEYEQSSFLSGLFAALHTVFCTDTVQELVFYAGCKQASGLDIMVVKRYAE